MRKEILLVNDTSLVCHHGCTLLMSTIYNEFKKNNIIIKDKIYFEQNLQTFFSEKKRNYDLILINGEGTIHGKKNADKKKVNEILQFIKNFKKEYKTPIILFNSTITALNQKQLNILKMVNKIYVREQYSQSYLSQNRINSKVIPDFLSVIYCKKKISGSKTIITDSSLIQKTLQLKNFCVSNKFTFVPLLYFNYLRYFRFAVINLFLPLKLNFMVNLYLYLKYNYSRKFLDNFNNSKIIITGRFHAIFLSIAMMKPFYTFDGDTHKVRGLIEMIGLNDRIINISKLKKNEINLKKYSASEIYKIKRFKKKSKKLILTFFRDLKNL